MSKFQIGDVVTPDPSVLEVYGLKDSNWFMSNLGKPMTVSSGYHCGVFAVFENSFGWADNWVVPYKVNKKRKYL